MFELEDIELLKRQGKKVPVYLIDVWFKCTLGSLAASIYIHVYSFTLLELVYDLSICSALKLFFFTRKHKHVAYVNVSILPWGHHTSILYVWNGRSK